MNAKQLQITVHGQTVELQLVFDRYLEQMFSIDWQIAHAYMSGEKNELSWRLKKRWKELKVSETVFNRDIANSMRKGNNPSHSYADFQILCTKLLAQYIQYLLNHETGEVFTAEEKALAASLGRERMAKALIMEAEDLGPKAVKQAKKRIEEMQKHGAARLIRIDIVDSVKEVMLARYDYRISGKNTIFLELSGSMLLGRIYMPYLYTGRIDASFIDRTLIHEFSHREEDATGLIKLYEGMKKRARDLHDRGGISGGWYHLEVLLHDLFSEGKAQLGDHRHSEWFTYDAPKLARIRQNLQELVSIEEREQAMDFVDNTLTPTARDGEYYAGLLMCFTVALALGPTITVRGEQRQTIPSSQLTTWLQENPVTMFQPPSPEQMKKARDLLRKLRGPLSFLDAYEKACDALGLSEDLRAFTSAQHQSLRLTANAAQQAHEAP